MTETKQSFKITLHNVRGLNIESKKNQWINKIKNHDIFITTESHLIKESIKNLKKYYHTTLMLSQHH